MVKSTLHKISTTIASSAGCIMFEETLYQSTAAGKPFVDVLREQGIIPGIKVDTGLQVGRAHLQSTLDSQPSPALMRMSLIAWHACSCCVALLQRMHALLETQDHLGLRVQWELQQLMKELHELHALRQVLPGTDGETATQGLDGLGDRCKAYYAQGARFAKCVLGWRAWRFQLSQSCRRSCSFCVACGRS